MIQFSTCFFVGTVFFCTPLISSGCGAGRAPGLGDLLPPPTGRASDLPPEFHALPGEASPPSVKAVHADANKLRDFLANKGCRFEGAYKILVEGVVATQFLHKNGDNIKKGVSFGGVSSVSKLFRLVCRELELPAEATSLFDWLMFNFLREGTVIDSSYTEQERYAADRFKAKQAGCTDCKRQYDWGEHEYIEFSDYKFMCMKCLKVRKEKAVRKNARGSRGRGKSGKYKEMCKCSWCNEKHDFLDIWNRLSHQALSSDLSFKK